MNKETPLQRCNDGTLEIPGENDTRFLMSDWEVEYHDHNMLLQYIKSGFVKSQIRGTDIHLIRGTGIQRITPPPGNFGVIKFDYFKDVNTIVYMIGYGGWAPCELIKNNAVILADRNIISEIQTRYFIGERKPNDVREIDTAFLCTTNAEIDLTLWAVEGNMRCEQTEAQVKSQYFKAKKIIQRSLPNLKIHDESSILRRICAINERMKPLMKKRVEFLVAVMPLVSKNFSPKNFNESDILNIMRSVISIADKYDLGRTDIAMILIVIRIVGRWENGKGIARRVTKDSERKSFSEGDAYNTVCDLFAIEYLFNKNITRIKDNLEPNAVLLTKDFGLAELATVMSQADNHSHHDGMITTTVSIPMNIFNGCLLFTKIYNLLYTDKE